MSKGGFMDKDSIINEIIEKVETYSETMDEIIEENKCSDCENLDCGIAQRGMCKIAILNDLKLKICELRK